MKDFTTLLQMIRDGHDQEAAAAALGLSKEDLDAGGDELTAEISAAFAVGSARLRSKVMEGALTDEDNSVLLRLLEKREQRQQALDARVVEKPMNKADWVRRVLFVLTDGMRDPEERDKLKAELLRFPCERCGRLPYTTKPPHIPSGSM